MARYLICPDITLEGNTVDYAVLTNASLRCSDSVDQSSEWVELASQPNLLNITDLLTSLSEFDLVQISMFISSYLVFFIIGITAGSVVRLMKKA
jgi:hypothetical protein